MESDASGMLDSESSDHSVIFVACCYSGASIGLRISKGVIIEGWKK